MVFDSDILIWHFRRNPAAIRPVDETLSREISVVSHMELLGGARDKEELRKIRSFLAEFSFRMLPLTESIGQRAAMYMEDFCLRIRMSIPDALVAATAVEYALPLATGNTKHFPPIEGLEIRPFRVT